MALAKKVEKTLIRFPKEVGLVGVRDIIVVVVVGVSQSVEIGVKQILRQIPSFRRTKESLNSKIVEHGSFCWRRTSLPNESTAVSPFFHGGSLRIYETARQRDGLRLGWGERVGRSGCCPAPPVRLNG